MRQILNNFRLIELEFQVGGDGMRGSAWCSHRKWNQPEMDCKPFCRFGILI